MEESLSRRFKIGAFFTYPLLGLVPVIAVLLLILPFTTLSPGQLFVILLTSFTVVTAIGWVDVRLRRTKIGLEIGRAFRTYREQEIKENPLQLGDVRGSINDGAEGLNTFITLIGWIIFVLKI